MTKKGVTGMATASLRFDDEMFDIVAPADPFYSVKNIERIKNAVQQIKDGKVVIKTIDELEAMACK